MKRHLIFCIALVAVMASCVKEPQIYRRLSDEESAIVPYQMGQTIRMLNQDSDTLCFTVVHDTSYVAYNYDDSRYHPYEKMIEPRPYFYAREVVLQSPPEDSCLLRCIVAPEKVTIGETTYEDVHVDQGSYMADTTMVSYAWYYSEQQGLIAAKHGDYSLTLIP